MNLCDLCNGARKNQHKPTIEVDIDGVLMVDTGRWDDYDKREFIQESVDKFKQLAQHYRLIANTSRKAEEAFWQTIRDFQSVGLDNVFECIYFDKPPAQYRIDDKAVNFQDIEDIRFLEELI